MEKSKILGLKGMDNFADDDITLQNLNITARQLRFKGEDSCPIPQGAITSPVACDVVNVLLHQGMKVEEGQPLFVMNVTKPKTPFPPSQPKKILSIKNFLEHSGVVIYSMKDVLAELDDPKHDPMAGLDNEESYFENFKRFDTVVDHSDHLFSAPSCWPMKQVAANWANKIHEEWSILKEHLPETIFVRAYEDRKDLLRAVMIGPKGTPYHDGIFFFDLCFPSNYPHSPPRVCSLSFYLGVCPNLNYCDEVRLIRMYTTAILENTWVPGTSNMLKYLVSIQGLVFNTKTLFNVLSMMGDTVAGGSPSLLYNENILIKSLKTMVCTMTKPPKHFEPFVVGHFRNRAQDILMACNSYKEGMQVGFLVSNNIHTCSTKFKRDSASCIKLLVKAFNKIGAREVEGFLHQIEMSTPPPASAATPVVDEDLYPAVVRKRKVTKLDTESSYIEFYGPQKDKDWRTPIEETFPIFPIRFYRVSGRFPFPKRFRYGNGNPKAFPCIIAQVVFDEGFKRKRIKHFEPFVVGHFRNRAQDILMACNSYKEGMQVGFLVSNNIHTCSTKFKRDSASCIKLLVKAFNKIGAKEVEGFLHQIEMSTPPPASAATPVVDEDLYPAVVRKRKVVFDEGFKRKRIKTVDHCYSWTVRSPSSFTVAKVLIEEGSQVEKGQPLYIMDSRELEVWNQTTQLESTVEKMVERKRRLHFGICSMEDVLMDQNHSRQMEGLGNEDVQKMYENFDKFDAAESSSVTIQNDLDVCFKQHVAALIKVGAKGTQEFLSL
ncbi:ubiquitin-conjugating enzyme/RWD-like protein [Artemisia annua]|uniref:Ubiquitin-conjugating enzyme/RWD-like protein n=1 Tax=Artemisia annua TaxID=35608 RepID=A0A2U1MQP9_ARTAN|nr:ubiquitin-conjugating enzyme/RWD-like protein [Artemisia annua]